MVRRSLRRGRMRPAGELFQRETAIYDDVGAHHE